MRIISTYRGTETEHAESDEVVILNYDDGSVRIRPPQPWNGDAVNKQWAVDIDPHQLLNLRDKINEQLSELTGVTLVTVSRSYLEALRESHAKRTPN